MSEDESLGIEYQLSFHPDDMGTAVRRWQHSLKTGEPYNTEYRCLSKHGEWRWMLARGLPMRNKQTGKIEKWLGTCTDINQSVESKFAAKRIVSNHSLISI